MAPTLGQYLWTKYASRVDTSLITGWLPALLTVVGIAALVGLIALPWNRNSWLRGLAVVGGTAIVVVSLDLFIIRVWRPFPDPIPIAVMAWVWLGLSGLALGVAHLAVAPKRVLALFAGLVAFVGIGVVQVNRHYGQFPTTGAALGVTRPTLTDLSTLDKTGDLLAAPPDGYLSEVWRADPVPEKGKIGKVDLPSTVSGFRARPAYVYLPPAYLVTDPRPLLPVLVLLAGQPGSTDAWLISGRLAERMDAYAARHRGLAPIVVLADQLGGTWANPLCIDSRRGNVETYLGVDVPEWVGGQLQAARRKEMWAIGGLSNGGTCALQMAVRKPEVYGRFLDIAGEGEPLDGNRKETIERYFGGDTAAYAAIDPMEIMARKRFEATAGRIAVGAGDPDRDKLWRTFQACQRAGMDMTWQELPGAHTWQVWAPALEQSLEWLAAKTNLVKS